jgi:protein gp37
MAKDSKIEWTDHTFNPWWGCSKVSPACQHCYADHWTRRTGHRVWGKTAPRRFLSDAQWKQPLAWNKAAQVQRKRYRVFCASMADVFEKRSELDPYRERLWSLINSTPCLDWLLLTKRPDNVADMTPWGRSWPENVWLGTTVENQKYAEERLPYLLRHDAAVRFVSAEPMLGAIDLTSWFHRRGLQPLDWVIAGGESGPGARPMHPDWPIGLLRQCEAAGVAFHFKQWGDWVPEELTPNNAKKSVRRLLSERQVSMVRLGKKKAGRILEGTTWDQFPIPALDSMRLEQLTHTSRLKKVACHVPSAT